jgi:hypothetical protein
MKPTRRSRRSAGSLLASAVLLAFLGWRAFAIAPRLPGLVQWRGNPGGLAWPLERRVQRAIHQSSSNRKAGSAEASAVLAMVNEHVEKHAVVMASLAGGTAGRQLGSLVAMLAFPRYVLPGRLTEKERARCRELAGQHGLYALVRAGASHPPWLGTATRVARTGEHELLRLEDRDQ